MKHNPDLLAAVRSIAGTMVEMARDFSAAWREIRHDQDKTNNFLQEHAEVPGAVRQLQEEAGKTADFRRYVESRFELLHDQMIDGFRALGAPARDLRAERSNHVEETGRHGRQRITPR